MTEGSAKLLAGQRALATGANSGIGEAMAIALGEAGADVVVNYVTGKDRAEAVADKIGRAGVRALAHHADFSDEAQVEAMFQRAIGEFGTIDILVNNAGLQRKAPFHAMTLEQWNIVISVNLTGRAPQRVRVNGIAPGAVRASINTAAWTTPEAYRKLMTLVPYGRIGEPEEIGRAAVWLASDQSDYVVGATVCVGGGMPLFPDFEEGG